jgi:plasmid stabilization system protein ParE
MTCPVIVRPDADADIQKIHIDLEQVRTGLGAKFAAQLRVVLERIESMPELHGVVWKDVRAARVKKFRYIAYYIVFSDRVEVLAVMDGARDSSAWQSRVRDS